MSARYMLDTDTASFVINGTSPSLDTRLASVSPDDLCVSSVTRAELLYGVHLKPEAHRLARVVELFLSRVPSLPWDDVAADHFARIAAGLHRAGRAIGTLDTMIAAHAVATGAILVTNNERHFARVTGLRFENWTSG